MTAEKGQFDGQSDVQKKPFTSEDILFTQSKDGRTLYAIVLEIPPEGRITVKSLAINSANWPDKIGSVELADSQGSNRLQFTRDESGLHVKLPEQFDGKTAFALKIQ
jgi:alpha-L-fucosidase